MPQHGILLDLLEITSLAIFPTPARKLADDPDWFGLKPDKDNVEKIILDALNPWLHDDAQVVAGPTVKIYAPKNVEPAVICLIDRPPPCPDHPVVKLLLPYAPKT
jgi:Holliday junction resolvase RusA-like endonuclease